MQQQSPQDQNMSQMHQQMMLCPVRLVYETQVLVQPGDQIHPNQTLFVNTSNLPPWIQNRSVQNQVLYLPQIQSNQMMPSLPQQMDQSQIYVQNFGQYQQVVPNYMAQNQQEQVRPIQYQVNVVPQNIPQNVSNVAPSIAQNVSNYTPTSNSGAIQNVTTIERQTPSLHQTQLRPHINAPNVKKAPEIMQPNPPQIVYQHQMQQMLRPQNMPQMSINPMQYLANGQVIDKNVANMQQTLVNAPNVRLNKPLNTTATTQTEVNKVIIPVNTARPSNVVNAQNQNRGYNMVYNQGYRPIQPRLQTNYSPVGVQTQRYVQVPNIAPNLQKPPIPTNINKPLNVQFTNVPSTPVQYENKNRKRKSESPDEIQKKISNIPSASNNIKLSPINTNPTKISSNAMTIEKINHNQNQIANVLGKPDNVQNDVKLIQMVSKVVKIKPNVTSEGNTTQETNKLLRNTVFTQARGRLPNHKELIPNIVATPQLDNQISQTVADVKEVVIVPKVEDFPVPVNPVNLKPVLKVPAQNENEPKMDMPVIEKPIEKIEDIKREEPKINSAVTVDVREKEVQLTAENDHIKKDHTEDSDSYVLTHVLDGFVIQESNIAFPIRKPLIEKMINTQTSEQTEKQETDVKDTIVDRSKIVQLTSLNLLDCKMESDENNCGHDKDNPFAELKATTIKAWTVDDLSSHLSKCRWSETASVFTEHELDGESLFLVSKQQLVSIGVREEHADVICEFVKS